MKELTAQDQHWLDTARKELLRAESLAKYNRTAAAQESLREVLFLMTNLPRWFTDTELETQFQQLYKQLYNGT